MNVKPNIGIINALIRITIGLSVMSCASAKLVIRPWRQSNFIWVVLGAMKVAEGIVRYCPVTDLYRCGQERMNGNQDENGALSEMVPHNPT
ncbi:DUF2892 domain-containing protein [Bacillus sp. JJ1773]|uniref:YgaP family membrane protein n=1 Tax=Bacillus sp. JJ1773 TaxID=3122965 RepID=UPI003000F979